MKKPNNFNYSGYEVPVSYIMRLAKYYGTFTTNRLIFWGVQYCKYKAKHGIKIELIKAIQSGIYKKWIWALISSEFESKEYIQAWIDKEIYSKPLKKDSRFGKCPVCRGSGKDWKTKKPCKVCEGSGRKSPDSIGNILKEIGI